MKKYQYGFEDHSLLTFDHELSAKEFYALIKQHGYLVGYTDGNKVYYYEENNIITIEL